MNNLKQNRKGIEMTLQTVVIFILLIIVLAVVSFFFVNNYMDNSGMLTNVGNSTIDSVKNFN